MIILQASSIGTGTAERVGFSWLAAKVPCTEVPEESQEHTISSSYFQKAVNVTLEEAPVNQPEVICTLDVSDPFHLNL